MASRQCAPCYTGSSRWRNTAGCLELCPDPGLRIQNIRIIAHLLRLGRVTEPNHFVIIEGCSLRAYG